MTLYFIIAGVIAFVLLLSIICLFFKKSRRIGKYTLSTIVVTIAVGAIVTYFIRQPLVFEKTYLTTPTDIISLEVKKNANNANVYLGAAPSNIEQMLRPEFKHVFNSITPENALKMSDLLNIKTMKYDFSSADIIIDEAIKNSIRVRGHALIFGKLSDVYKKPDLDLWLTQFPEEERKTKLANLFNTYIETVLTHFKGRVFEWDVINEPLAMFGNGALEDNVFYRYLGEYYIEQAFLKAKSVDSNISLYLNEQFYNYTDERAEAFYQLVVSLISKNIPINGIGLQGHMLFYLATPEETASYVKRFTDLGLKVQLTEFEARLRLFKNNTDPYLAQGVYYRDVMKACYAIKGFDGVTFWGVDDGRSWLNDMSWLFPLPNEPYLLDEQQRAKPGLLLINEMLKTIR